MPATTFLEGLEDEAHFQLRDDGSLRHLRTLNVLGANSSSRKKDERILDTIVSLQAMRVTNGVAVLEHVCQGMK